MDTALLAVLARLVGHARVSLAVAGLKGTALDGQEVHGGVSKVVQLVSPRSSRSSHPSSAPVPRRASTVASGRTPPCRSLTRVEKAGRVHSWGSGVLSSRAAVLAPQDGPAVGLDGGGSPSRRHPWAHLDSALALSGETSGGIAAGYLHHPIPPYCSSSHSTLENCMDSWRGLDRRDGTDSVGPGRQAFGFQGSGVQLDV